MEDEAGYTVICRASRQGPQVLHGGLDGNAGLYTSDQRGFGSEETGQGTTGWSHSRCLACEGGMPVESHGATILGPKPF